MDRGNKFSSHFKWNSTKTKLIAGMTAVSIIPTISIAIISHLVTEDIITKEVSNSTAQVTKQASRSLDNKIDGVVSQLQLLADNVNFKEFYNDPSNAKFGYYLLDGTLRTNRDYAFVYFASTKKDMLSAPDSELPEDYDPTTRDWYLGALKNNGKVFYSEPYQDEGTGQVVLTISQTVKDNTGNLVGVMAIDLDMRNFSKSIEELKIGKHGYLTMLSPDGTYIYHPEEKKIGSDAVTKLSLWNDLKKNKEGYSEYKSDGEDKFSAFTTNDKTGWKFVSELNYSEINDNASKIGNIGWILTSIFGVLSALSAFFIGRRIANNINAVKDALETASKGDFTARVKVNTKDEFKDLEQSFNKTMEQLSRSLRKVEESSRAVLETSGHLSEMTKETNASLSEVATAIEEIAQGANLQVNNVNESSDQMRELSQQLDGISASTITMNDASQLSMVLTSKGLEQVEMLTGKSSETKVATNEVTAIVKEVDGRMEEINEIIGAITKITDQTNLLALNASIESARAGEHGRGFAVVANEVRKLAEQSRTSAEEIKRIVDSIKAVVKKAVEAMEMTNQAVTEQDVTVTETKAIFNDILSAILELSQKVGEVQGSIYESQENKESVSLQIESITAVSQQTAAATEEVSASAEEISATMSSFTQYAAGLKELSEQLEQELEKFKL